MGRTKLQAKIVPVEKKVLNKEEAMVYLGVGEDYLTKLRNENEIVFSQKDRMIWYDLASLDRFLRKYKCSINYIKSEITIEVKKLEKKKKKVKSPKADFAGMPIGI